MVPDMDSIIENKTIYRPRHAPQNQRDQNNPHQDSTRKLKLFTRRKNAESNFAVESQLNQSH